MYRSLKFVQQTEHADYARKLGLLFFSSAGMIEVTEAFRVVF